MFPPHVREADAALDYLATWYDIVGGEQLDGIDWVENLDHAGEVALLRVQSFRIAFDVGTILTIAMDVDTDLRPSFYRFDFRMAGELLWRHDCHPGHETLGTGAHHIHVGPAENDRRADRPQTLQTIFEHVNAENLRLSWEPRR